MSRTHVCVAAVYFRQGMTDRLDAIGGAVRVQSAAGEGTTVTGSIPVARVGDPK